MTAREQMRAAVLLEQAARALVEAAALMTAGAREPQPAVAEQEDGFAVTFDGADAPGIFNTGGRDGR